MVDEHLDFIKQEVKHGINQSTGRIITDIFDVLLKPILDFIKKRSDKIYAWLEKREQRSLANYDIHISMLMHYLNKNNLDVIMFVGHNGKESHAGFSFEYLEVIFENIQAKSDAIKRAIESSVKRYTYSDFLEYCRERRDFTECEINANEKLHAHFPDYKNISFRQHRCVVYAVLSEDHLTTKTEDGWINKMIDELIRDRK